MTQRISFVRDPEFTGELTFSRAPGGTLSFEDGVAHVDDDVDVAWVVERYPNLAAGDAPAPDESDSDDDDESDTDDSKDADDAATDADEFDEMSYDELQSRAGEHDDIKGNQSADELRAALREKEA